MLKISDFDDCGHDSFGEFGRCLYKYTSCGPWVVAVLPGGREVYYESKEAHELPMDTEIECLRVGSIVEGSEVYVGPFDVTDPKDWNDTIKQIDEECDSYWKRDNLDHFKLLRNGAPIGGIVCGWGEFDLGLDGVRITKTDRKALEAFCRDGAYCTLHSEIAGAVTVPEYGDVIAVPGTKLSIEFVLDDSTY